MAASNRYYMIPVIMILFFLLATLRLNSCQTITSLQPETAVRVVPGPLTLNNLFPFVFLTCIPEPSTLTTSDFVSRWTLPSGQTFTNNQPLPPGFERFRVSQGRVATEAGVRNTTLLFVGDITYQDAGNYTCEVRSSSAPPQSEWLLAMVELQLEVNLTAIESSVTAYSNDSEVELQCEMTLYIRADEDLQWFNGSMMITSGTNRHTISYHNGTAGAAQNGGSILIPGRVSVLTISNPQQSDAGTYSCRILGTEQSADIQLNVMSTQQNTLPPTIAAATPTEQSADIQLNVMPTQQNTLPPTISPATTPTGLWTAVTHSTTTLPSGIAAVLIVVSFIILATITVSTILIVVLLVRRKMFKMTANGAYGKNVHHSETATPSNTQTEPTDYVNEGLEPNQPTSEDYSYVLPEPSMQRNPAYQLTSELH